MSFDALFAQGRPVADIAARSPDAEFILEGDEFEYEWREIQVTPQSLPSPTRTNPRAEAELRGRPMTPFTQQYPPLYFLWGAELELLDGNHRLAEAIDQDCPVTVMIARPPVTRYAACIS